MIPQSFTAVLSLYGKHVPGARSRTRKARRPAFRPELLESRTLLSAFQVSNSLDSGVGSLRQAILDANAAPGGDSITFDRSVRKITLTSGELGISGDLTITGPGARKLTISGHDTSRIFDVAGGATVSISGLTVTRGRADGSSPVYPSCGGGILNLGILSLDGVVVDSNTAVGDPNVVLAGSSIFNSLGGALGGGIENFGTLNVTDSTISNNQAIGADNADGSALPFPSFSGNALGGGIGNFATVTVTDSTIKGNQARAGDGGIGAFAGIGGGGALVNDGNMTLSGTTVRDNEAIGGSHSLSPTHNGHALGGGIMSGTLLALLGAGSASLTVSDSAFACNLAQGGHDNQVTDAFVPLSDAPDNAYGGAIAVYQGTASISCSTITQNQASGGTGYGINGQGSAGVGGGIFFYNFVGGVTGSVDGCTIRDNSAIGGDGEAGVNGGNGLGGGIAVGSLSSPYAGSGDVQIRNSTVTRNLAQGGQGGCGASAGNGLGGGLFSDTSSLVTILDTSITRNKARGGRGNGGHGIGDNTYEGTV